MKSVKLPRGGLAPIVAAIIALGVANQAAAAVATYNFGDLLPGQTGLDNSSIWATLTVTTDTTNSSKYIFNLSLNNNFSSLFGSSAFVSEAVFNTPSGLDPTSATISSGTWGVSTVTLVTNAPNLGLGFDFGDCFGSGSSCSHGGASGRLTAGESVNWVTKFGSSQGDPLAFGTPPAGLHVQYGTSSAWYGPAAAPVPEPETYAMLLVGLGLLGFTARHRKNTAA